MKKITFLISTLLFALCFTNCKEKTYFKEIVSEKNVGITLAEFPKNREDLVVTIPLEFNLYLNNFPNIWFVNIYYEKDNRLCSDVDDYIIYNSKSDEIIFSLDRYQYPNYPNSIYLVERKMRISKEEAQKFIERYNPKTAVENIKSTNDTIPLVSYKKFREDNPKFIEELRRVPDSITFVIQKKKEKDPILIKEKINW
ncbi:hypothetical protein IUY40_09345 [Flavobacterium sp. ALJ2]|uniref:hypothetical protein n=1 Tax=Flavobacterium sp. ALJ2 TaxID=2786960 RepID=UPI00189D07AE|nr:hypothetical protein [Flavobacterium sp. ALJ2]MBF7091746.1 hypothetical protein [Flavobacterium sp. ALJ2]